MTVRKCVVKLVDEIGTTHTATVHADSLHEATLLGLNELSKVGWESESRETIGSVLVEVHLEPTLHEVNVPSFLRWLKRPSGDRNIEREKQSLRSILK
jgi:hypothetical protein